MSEPPKRHTETYSEYCDGIHEVGILIPEDAKPGDSFEMVRLRPGVEATILATRYDGNFVKVILSIQNPPSHGLGR